MPITFLQLKADVRSRVFPSGEARNLRPAHDKSIVDALIDMQRWVNCLQSNNTHLVPHCATYYKCGITSFDFARSRILRLSVIDKINPETHKEDATAADDYCSEIEYQQVDACHMRRYFGRSETIGCCNISEFFAIPTGLCGGKWLVPVPTDVGVPTGLPIPQLGYHYPQESTNSTCGRAARGVWSVENGRVHVAPWIQSTETIVVKWSGIKRDWVDADLVDDDPTLIRGVETFLRWENMRDWDKNQAGASYYELEYKKTLQELMYDCAQENLVRTCESETQGGMGAAGGARGIAPVVKLFYNDRRQATETCPGNQTGGSITITVEAETVASTISKLDANNKAFQQARSLALQQLGCEDQETVYYNVAKSATASCADLKSVNSPVPEGSPVTATVPAGAYTSTVSQRDADDSAEDAASLIARAMLSGHCTFWNSEQTATAECPPPTVGPDVSRTVMEHEHSSTISQSDADRLADDAALIEATNDLVCTGVSQNKVYCNTAITRRKTVGCTRDGTSGGFGGFVGSPGPGPGGGGTPTFSCTMTAQVTCPDGVTHGPNQNAAQLKAEQLCQIALTKKLNETCTQYQQNPNAQCPNVILFAPIGADPLPDGFCDAMT